MAHTIERTDVALGDIAAWIKMRKGEGARFVQLLAVNVEGGNDLVYTLRDGNVLREARVACVGLDEHVPSITGDYPAAFVFENEIHDLFGVQVDGISIDFHGKFYRLALDKPMTIVSPEKQAAREKARKMAEARAKAQQAAREKAAESEKGDE